jgi:hypothetical protein
LFREEENKEKFESNVCSFDFAIKVAFQQPFESGSGRQWLGTEQATKVAD